MNIPKTCLTCGKVFSDPKHPNRKYCSLECSRLAQQNREDRQCEYCGKTFTVLASKQKRFCNRKCSALATQKRQSDKHKTCICEWCGTSFDVRHDAPGRFCSSQCRSEFAARQPKTHARRPENRVELICEICGKRYMVHKSQITGRKSRFCSDDCRYQWVSIARRGAGNVNYRGGTIRYRGANWGRQSRLALKRDGYRCQICHKKISRVKWDYGVHHIRPYREFNGDYKAANELSNLITLCRSCHGKAEFGDLACPMPLI